MVDVDNHSSVTNPSDPSLDNNPATTGAGNIDGISEALLRNGTGMTLAGSDGFQGGTYTPGTYQVNYPAILKWIKQPPLCVPPNLRSGRVLYYSRIPDDVSGNGDPDKAFWKKYIDFVLSNRRDHQPRRRRLAPGGDRRGVHLGPQALQIAS